MIQKYNQYNIILIQLYIQFILMSNVLFMLQIQTKHCLYKV